MNDRMKEMLEDEAVVFPEFEHCIAGVVLQANNGNRVVCYDYEKVIATLSKDMSEDEAIEHFYFNIAGAYLGEYTPCFLFRDDTDASFPDV